jgi:hypothetical protein
MQAVRAIHPMQRTIHPMQRTIHPMHAMAWLERGFDYGKQTFDFCFREN